MPKKRGIVNRNVNILLRILAIGCRVPDLHAAAPLPSRDYVEGEVIVTFKASVSLNEGRRALAAHQLQFTKHFAVLSAHRQRQTGLVRAEDRTTAELIAELRTDPSVELMEPNYLRWPCGGTPNDPLFGQMWALRNTGQTINGLAGTSGADIKFAEAWNLARTSTNPVVVAVIDSGVDYTHPDLAASMWTNPGEIANNGVDEDGNGYADDYYGYDLADGDSNPTAAGIHGTHIAGIIAATGNNQLGVIGVDYQAKIMALKVANDANPTGFADSAIIAALDYCVTMKKRGVNLVAINASWGSTNANTALRDAITAAGNAGIIVCAGAGNNAINNDLKPFYPASYHLPNMIVVAASDMNDGLASFSDYSTNTVDLAAPGDSILSTIPVALAGTTSWVQRASSRYVANSLEYSGVTSGIATNLYDCGLGYPSNFPAAVRGNIALISRGSIFFSEKVSNAMAAGARAAVIYNNTSGNFSGSLQNPGNWIPAISLSQADGLALKAGLPALATVVNVVDPARIYDYLDGTSMATPHVCGAVAFAAMNFPSETLFQRIQRVLSTVDPVPALQGKVRTGGRLNLRRLVDADSNGLPDWWEQAYFGHLTGTDPNADPDRDGASNRAEWLAGTNPTNGLSAFRLESVQRIGADMRLTWTTVGGHGYRLQFATNSGGGMPTNFVNLGATLMIDGASGGTTNYVHLGGATNSAGYYRVRLE